MEADENTPSYCPASLTDLRAPALDFSASDTALVGAIARLAPKWMSHEVAS